MDQEKGEANSFPLFLWEIHLIRCRSDVSELPLIFCAVLLRGATVVWTYDEVQVTDGDTIAGKVTMVGYKTPWCC